MEQKIEVEMKNKLERAQNRLERIYNGQDEFTRMNYVEITQNIEWVKNHLRRGNANNS